MKFRIILFFLGILFSCVKPPPLEKNAETLHATKEKGAYILNEGNFQWGNARLDYIHVSEGNIQKDVFFTQNARKIGDVLQSGEIINNQLWLVVNNSGKIEIVQPDNAASIKTLSGLQSPRYVIKADENTAYVSDLYANGIHIISLPGIEKTGFIPLPGWTEKMLLDSGRVWVTNLKKEYVYRIQTGSNQILDSILVGLGNNSVVKDIQGNIWILCSGSADLNIAGRLVCLHPVSGQILRSYPFSDPGGTDLQLSPDKSVLYWLKGGIWKMEIQSSVLPTAPLISAGSEIFYGLKIHPSNPAVYVMNAGDYVSEGQIMEYDFSGSFLRSFRTGIIPGDMVFY